LEVIIPRPTFLLWFFMLQGFILQNGRSWWLHPWTCHLAHQEEKLFADVKTLRIPTLSVFNLSILRIRTKQLLSILINRLTQLFLLFTNYLLRNRTSKTQNR
jgi:hypothetical protein